MPTSPLKRPSAGGRLGRLLASLRPPSRAGPLPVQTGFPTSLADLVVKNHVRLKNPRRRHRSSAALPSPSPPVATAIAEPPPPQQQQQQQRREASPVQNAVVRPKAKGAAFRIRPELLVVGGAVVLALLAIWSKWLVAAATAASVALFWIESVRSPASRRRPRPETPDQDVRGSRGFVSPIREAESEAETPRSSSADSDDRGSEVSSLWVADAATHLRGSGDDSVTPKTKEKRRSLRKLIAKKLRNGKRSKDKDTTASRDGGESKHPDAAGEAGVNARPVKAEPLPAPATDTTPPDAFPNERSRHGGAFPTAAFIPIVLVGLVAGKLPAVALTVLCAVFFSSVERVPSS